MKTTTLTLVSAALVGGMLVHAAEGVAHGKAPSETHLITGVPLSLTASSSAAAMDFVQPNAVFDALHAASVPRETELRLGGLAITLP